MPCGYPKRQFPGHVKGKRTVLKTRRYSCSAIAQDEIGRVRRCQKHESEDPPLHGRGLVRGRGDALKRRPYTGSEEKRPAEPKWVGIRTE